MVGVFVSIFFSPFSPVWLAADSLSFSPAFNASWVELWNKHQEVIKQKALEKTSKEIENHRNWLLQPPHNCQLPRCRVNLHLWHTGFIPTRIKVCQKSLLYVGDQTDQFALGKLCSNVSSFYVLSFFPPLNAAFLKKEEADILHPHHTSYIWKDFNIFCLFSKKWWQILLSGIYHEQFTTTVNLQQEILLRRREKVHVKNYI